MTLGKQASSRQKVSIGQSGILVAGTKGRRGDTIAIPVPPGRHPASSPPKGPKRHPVGRRPAPVAPKRTKPGKRSHRWHKWGDE